MDLCARPGLEGDPRLWEEQRAVITRCDHPFLRGPSLRGEASLSFSGSFPSRTRGNPALSGRMLSLCICGMGTPVQLGGSSLAGPERWTTCCSHGCFFWQSESRIPCASLSVGVPNRWRRTRWRAVATRPLGLASRRSPLRAACVWAPRKRCLQIAATRRLPQD